MNISCISKVISKYDFSTAKCPEKDETIIEKAAVKLVRDTIAGGYKVIRSDELKSLIDKNPNILMINTAPNMSCLIPGAKTFVFPIEKETVLDLKFEKAFIKLLGKTDDLPIIFYCGYTNPGTRSHNAALWAVKLGYKNVFRNPGGIKAWSERGYPVEILNQ
jgi:rhodanese-related sulfurtransferase